MLKIQNLSVSYLKGKKEFIACKEIDLEVEKTERVVLIGESGAGKSTVGLSITKLLPQNARYKEGKIIFKNKDILRLKEADLEKIRGAQISYIFQEPFSYLDPLMKAGEQIREVFYFHRKMSKKGSYLETLKLLERLKFSEPLRVYNSYPHELSGGMNQRIMIAIATALNPELIIADEPTSSLDFFTAKEITNFLKDVFSDSESALLLITHDLELAKSLAEKVYVIYKGQILEKNTISNIFNKPLHPYTKSLLETFEGIRERKIYTLEKLRKETPFGCVFYSFCEYAKSICERKPPFLKRLNDIESVRCHLY